MTDRLPHPASASRLRLLRVEARIKTAGFHELTVSDAELKRLGGSPIVLQGGVLREEAVRLFRRWTERPDAKLY